MKTLLAVRSIFRLLKKLSIAELSQTSPARLTARIRASYEYMNYLSVVRDFIRIPCGAVCVEINTMNRRFPINPTHCCRRSWCRILESQCRRKLSGLLPKENGIAMNDLFAESCTGTKQSK